MLRCSKSEIKSIARITAGRAMLETEQSGYARQQNIAGSRARDASREGREVGAHSPPRAKVFMASAISSCVGGSATTGMLLAAPLGTQDMAEIIPAIESSSIGDEMSESSLSFLWLFVAEVARGGKRRRPAARKRESERELEDGWLCRPRKSGGGLGFR